MGKTFKDQNRYDSKKKMVFPRVPPIEKRSEAFDDRRLRKEKHVKKFVDFEEEVYTDEHN